ncbi:MAG: hypothetical protein ACRD2P_17230 [Terriglobia bacterium]
MSPVRSIEFQAVVPLPQGPRSCPARGAWRRRQTPPRPVAARFSQAQLRAARLPPVYPRVRRARRVQASQEKLAELVV